MSWVGGTLYPGGQDTVPTVSCPRGQDEPGEGGDILPRGKVSLGTRYRGDKINWYTGMYVIRENEDSSTFNF